tara:strand:- start:4138 stop:6981 length:2844 start_codon:yes stop_codon:yes gene_type:complete
MAREEEEISRHVPSREKSLSDQIANILGRYSSGDVFDPEKIKKTKAGAAAMGAKEALQTAGDFYGPKLRLEKPIEEYFGIDPTSKKFEQKQSYEDPQVFKNRQLEAGIDSNVLYPDNITREAPQVIEEYRQQEEFGSPQMSIELGPGETPPGLPIESMETEKAVQALMAKIGMDEESARKAVEKSRGNTTGAAVDASAPVNLADPEDDLTKVRNSAIADLYGEGSAFGSQGKAALTAMTNIAGSQAELTKLNKMSQYNTDLQLGYNDEIAAQKLKALDATEDYQKQKYSLDLEAEGAQRKAYDEYFGPEGKVTKADKLYDSVLSRIKDAGSEEREGPFGFSSWPQTWRTLGSLVVIGAEAGARFGLGSENIPKFGVPIVMKMVEADMANQDALDRKKKGAATSLVSIMGRNLETLTGKQDAIKRRRELGVETAKSYLQAKLAQVPQGSEREAFIKNMIVGLDQEIIDSATARESKYKADSIASTQSYTSTGAAKIAADSAVTARGIQKLNALKVLQSKGKKSVWNSKEREAYDSRIQLIQTSRNIKRTVANILEVAGGSFDSIDTALNMGVMPFIKKFADNDDPTVQTLLAQLTSQFKLFSVDLGKSKENRLTNEDYSRYEAVTSLETQSLSQALMNLQELEYGVRETVLTGLVGVMGTADWDRIARQGGSVEAAFGSDPIELINKFRQSVRGATEQLSKSKGGVFPRFYTGLQQFSFNFTKDGPSGDGLKVRQLLDRLNKPLSEGYKSAFDARAIQDYRQRMEKVQGEQAKRFQSKGVTPEATSIATKSKDKTEDNNVVRYGPILSNQKISSKFGPRTLNNKETLHNGVDFIAPKGTTVMAPAQMKITEVGKNHEFNGNYVRMVDKFGFEWTFLHLDTIASFDDMPKSADGFPIIQGAFPFGTTGNTGRVHRSGGDGSHLHVQIKNLATNTVIDPEPYMAAYSARR